jgi:hypothetical protein
MRRLAIEELVAVDAYEELRDAYRARVMAYKAPRRLAVGDRVTIVFENRETIRFQVQEMMRIERLRDPEKVQAELDVYNELVPGEAELSATLLIEITDAAQIRAELDLLRGLDEQVVLALGSRCVRARFDERQLDAERISAVHYLRFALTAEDVARLREPAGQARIQIEHPRYRAEASLPPALCASLSADLAGDPAPLLSPPAGGGVVEARGRASLAPPRIRVRPSPRPVGRGHVIVEPIERVASLLHTDPALDAELLASVREQVRAILGRFGACRVLCDVHEGELRWHVFAPGEEADPGLV